MQQRLESTYFSLLSLYNKIISDLNLQTNKSCYFKELKEQLCSGNLYYSSPEKQHEKVKEKYLDLFYEKKEDLSHYFKLLYRIIKTIDDSEISTNEKFRYIKILRSQLSENEMLILYYNSHTHLGGDLYKLILKYNLLKHLPIVSKLEFKSFITENMLSTERPASIKNKEKIKRSFLHRFNDETIILLKKFNDNLINHISCDDFESHTESYPMPGYNDLFISFYSDELYLLNIEITPKDPSHNISNLDINGFTSHQFKRYIEAFIYDIYLHSRYISDEDNSIKSDIIDNKLIITIEFKNKLIINNDIE